MRLRARWWGAVATKRRSRYREIKGGSRAMAATMRMARGTLSSEVSSSLSVTNMQYLVRIRVRVRVRVRVRARVRVMVEVGLGLGLGLWLGLG